MDKVRHFFDLKAEWIAASDTRRQEIDRELSALMGTMSVEELDALTDGIQEDFNHLKQETSDVKEIYAVRAKLQDVLPYISVSAIARKYFGKTSSWFYQRLNGNNVHGRPAAFDHSHFSAQTLLYISNSRYFYIYMKTIYYFCFITCMLILSSCGSMRVYTNPSSNYTRKTPITINLSHDDESVHWENYSFYCSLMVTN